MALDELRFKRTVIESCLRSSQLLLGLPAEDIQSIAAMVIPKRLAKGDYLFRKGDPAEGFYIVQRGAINIHRVSSLGKEQVIHVFRPVESFAEAALAAPSGYPADARAMTASNVLLVPKRDFVHLLSKRPELGLRMLGSLRRCVPICTQRPNFFAAATIHSPSCGLWLHGFSTYTCLPALQAMIVAGPCQ